MTTQRVKFTFVEQLIKEPIIWKMAKEFDVVTNIRRADVTDERGWVVLEIEGDGEEIERSLDWVRENGDSYFRRVGRDPVLGTIVDTVELSATWAYDSRDRYLFPTRGGSHRLTLTVTPPGGAVEFATANLHTQQYFRLPIPLIDKLPLSITANVGWGMAFGDTTALPPNRHTFTGGPDTVRGFRDGTLGPRDSLGNPYGGDSAIYGTAEAILPMPSKWQTSARVSLFYDFGQAFYLGDTKFLDKAGKTADTSLSFQRLRSSTGISVQWLAPMGLFRFSYAVPLSWQRETNRLFGDDRERFQFSVGNAF